MKPTKYCLKKEGGRRGVKECHREGELVQNILHAAMKFSQSNPLTPLMYPNKN
jgi:hypothetical protein